MCVLVGVLDVLTSKCPPKPPHTHMLGDCFSTDCPLTPLCPPPPPPQAREPASVLGHRPLTAPLPPSTPPPPPMPGDLLLFWAIDGGVEMMQLLTEYGADLDTVSPKVQG